jgi:hypothetical protein
VVDALSAIVHLAPHQEAKSSWRVQDITVRLKKFRVGHEKNGRRRSSGEVSHHPPHRSDISSISLDFERMAGARLTQIPKPFGVTGCISNCFTTASGDRLIFQSRIDLRHHKRPQGQLRRLRVSLENGDSLTILTANDNEPKRFPSCALGTATLSFQRGCLAAGKSGLYSGDFICGGCAVPIAAEAALPGALVSLAVAR